MDIRKTEHINLLGVYTDENLNSAGYISEYVRELVKKLGILVRLPNWNVRGTPHSRQVAYAL